MKDMEVKKVKCSKCGFLNVSGTEVCVKCKTPLKKTRSCPRCAKKNKIENDRCENCGYKFGRKRGTILFNLIISLLLVGVLSLLVYFKHNGAVSNFSNGLKVLSGLFICLLLYGTINYGRKDINKFSAEEEFVDNDRFDLLKKISNIAIIIGTIVVVCFLLYYYFIR